LKKLGVFLGLWLLGGMVRVSAQQTTTDSLQKRFSQLVTALDTLRPDTLKKAQVLKDSLTKALVKKPIPKLNPRKAAYYSLMFPGLGQAYNKQYWKMPFVYAGFGTVVYFIRYYNIRYQDFLQPYIASYNANTGQFTADAEVYIRSQKQTRTLTIDQITKVKDIYRRYRDLNIILLTGVWALAAVEANVSAHLITFDMSEDISFRFEPDASFNPFTGNLYGVKAIIPIK
jgi:hypothetical protein